MLNQTSKVGEIYLQIIKVGIFIIIFLPLFVERHFLFPFVVPRSIAFRIIIEVCLIFYLALLISDKKFRPRWSMMLGLLTAFIGIMTLASLHGVNWHHSFWSSVERSEGIITWLHLLAFFVILSGTLKTKDDWLQLFKLVIVAGWLQTLYTLSQFFNLSFTFEMTGERLAGAIGNPSFLATYLLFIIFIAIYLYTESKSKIVKLNYLGLALIDSFLIWQTQTRGAVLALILGLLIFISLKLWSSKKPHAKTSLTLILALLVVAVIFLIINKDADWVESSGTLSRLTTISPTDITTQNRLIVWGVGFQAFLARPLLGWGWENFDVPFTKYFNPILARDVGSHPWYDRAHNVMVETAVNIGIVGLALYLAIIIWTLKLLWSSQKSKNLTNTAAFLLTSLILAHFFQNIFVFDTLNSYLMLFLIMAFSQSQQSPTEEKKAVESKITTNKIIFSSVLLIIIAVPIIYLFNIRPALANYYIIKTVSKDRDDPEKMLVGFKKSFNYSPPADSELRFILIQFTRDKINQIGINEKTVPLIQFAIEEVKKSLAVSPYYIQNYLLLAELYLAATPLDPNYLQLAEEVTLESLELAPRRYQVYTLLGRIKISQGQYEEGIQYLKQATELNDNFAEGYWNLAIAYILSRQPDLAQQALDQALERGYQVYKPENINLLLLAFRDSRDLKATIDFLEMLTRRFPGNTEYQKSLESLNQIYQQAIEAVQQKIELPKN
ncbi:MAG: hypothetical protein A3J62_03325 [Candidatus Buchananbacteria bacterium RIFCSPHIGHO2_02_FULL_38_8]|uniref:O-antigen ligase-related domain-containing protein n=2 Tax=Candidatus Buchananiibacteriota TaxID=1817903 RepID=A0A1G1XU41_9BACT|nr:MAG: hypothetical protein A2731_02340 [Candidatus Buchananbacteria bacterium RIFCSPHIGHO2_01_FULL_39_8]OGY47527.1 MAG: hypothetical protein A3J62_03325 [Candidatus Buchananbacteria bacterium RIFCSPHIGHO2_02_FULL_38_8]